MNIKATKVLSLAVAESIELMEPVMETTSERESKLQSLADRLQFTIVKTQDRYTLTRTADVPRPVCEEELTLEQAEEMLETWKLRGLHGG